MKKILFFVIILLIAAGILYKWDIKPEVKEVVKEVNTTKSPDKNVPK